MRNDYDPTEWRKRGICAQTDPEVFYPEHGESGREAKRICRGNDERPECPVRKQCLQYALAQGERFGIWGGYSERERRSMKVRAA